jgi:uncharacterized DUF497 family protein
VIEFDNTKREITLFTRGLDMARANEVFDKSHLDQIDVRKDYGEARIRTFGYLDKRPVFIIWAYRGNIRRIISMRRANEREIQKYEGRLG